MTSIRCKNLPQLQARAVPLWRFDDYGMTIWLIRPFIRPQGLGAGQIGSLAWRNALCDAYVNDVVTRPNSQLCNRAHMWIGWEGLRLGPHGSPVDKVDNQAVSSKCHAA